MLQPRSLLVNKCFASGFDKVFSSIKRMARLRSLGSTSKFWRQTWSNSCQLFLAQTLTSAHNSIKDLFLWPSIMASLLTLNICNLYSLQIRFRQFSDGSHVFAPVSLCFPHTHSTAHAVL